jgi:single-strand DNA-binding protein
MIKLQIIGNLGKDCIENDVNGKHVINFSVAHTERYKDAQGNQQDRTTWVECAYWTDRVGIAPYLKRGQMVYVEGTPNVDAYTNKENAPAATLRLRVGNVQLLGGSKGNTDGQQANSNYGNTSNAGYANQAGSTPAPIAQTPPPMQPMGNTAGGTDDLPF